MAQFARDESEKPARGARLRVVEDSAAIENREWQESLEAVWQNEGPERVRELLELMESQTRKWGIERPVQLTTPYINTIPREKQAPFAGDLGLERRITSLMRWNAMAMVVRANRVESGIGGHISTYASCADLYEVGFNHFFRGREHPNGGDHVYFQGHASPGNYARAFLEGRLSERQLGNFRMEVRAPDGLSSYPHPYLMPDFWEFPTVSMGLGPIQAVYRARFMRYLENRGLREPMDAKVWAFVGDGECDEPEALGAIGAASRESLDNLVFVINCNLQRLDGPVRGNGKIIQELEAIFRGVGWNVIKLIWSGDWDPLFAQDPDSLLLQSVNEIRDGDFQRCTAQGGACTRELIFGRDPRLKALVENLSDEQLGRLRVGGHDPEKIFAAYHAAVATRGRPTVILAQTVKGYGQGEAGEGRNVSHQQKKMTELELRAFRDRFEIPISDHQIASVPFFRPPGDSLEMQYLLERRRSLGGFVPKRPRPVSHSAQEAPMPRNEAFVELLEGSARPIATTMAMVRQVSLLLQDEKLGPRVVPIVPDEARTFGMESLFRHFAIYSSVGQLYEPVDRGTLSYYHESKTGQMLEEGITEAGSMCSAIAAGTSHVFHGAGMVPFYFFYSMFGFQRIGDLVWAAGDQRARGFLIGATAGRTTLAGEGLQHQDGQSQLYAQAYPSVHAYDPAYAYEIAVIVKEGLRRMLEQGEDVLYYLTAYNETYAQPAFPGEGVREGIIRGIYLLKAADSSETSDSQVALLGSGPILNEALKAQAILKEEHGIAADVWSVTSVKELRQEALDADRWNLLHPEEPARVPFITQALSGRPARSFVFASDYLKAVPDLLAKWIPGPLASLGTDGYGRSDGRAQLRDFFEVDARHIARAALSSLIRNRSSRQGAQAA